MNKETEIILFYIAAKKGGNVFVNKDVVSGIEQILKENEQMSLRIKELKNENRYQVTLLDSKVSKETFQEIIGYLNQKVGSNFKWTAKQNQKAISARIAEGYSIEDFRRVIDNKFETWKCDKKMCTYLRPSTLFGNKFESYLNEQPPHTPGRIGGKPSFDINEIAKDASMTLDKQFEEGLKRKKELGLTISKKYIQEQVNSMVGLTQSQADEFIKKYANED